MSRLPDAVVVGAGIVGAACALALAREGMRVLILEAGCAGGGTTAAAMGHLVVMDDSPAQLALTAWSLRLWRDLAAELPAGCEDDPCGTLWLAASEAEMEQARQRAATYRAHGVAAEVIDAAQLAAAEPRLRPGLAGALHVPGDRVIYPPNAARFLLARAAGLGAELRQGWRVTRLASGLVEGIGSGAGGVDIEGGKVGEGGERGGATRGSRRAKDGAGAGSGGAGLERIAAPVVVNAAGAAAAALTPGLPVVPRKGHLVITDRYPGFCHHQLVELGYLASAHGGHAPPAAWRAAGAPGPRGPAPPPGPDAAGPGGGAAGAAALRGREMPPVPAGAGAAGAESGGAASVAFNVQPRATGQLLIGSSRELAGWDSAINHGQLRRMLRRALEYLPGLAGAAVLRTWVGFRPATPDSLPLIGPWPEVPGLWIAAGHEGLGITTSLATGQLLADLVTGRRPALDCAPFAPGRLAGGAAAGRDARP